MEIHRSGHDRRRGLGHVPHVISAQVSRRVTEPVRKHTGCRVVQETSRLNDIACDTYRPCFLFLQITVCIGVDDASHFARVIVIDVYGHHVGSQLEVVSR